MIPAVRGYTFDFLFDALRERRSHARSMPVLAITA
jgi:hypothetical protein